MAGGDDQIGSRQTGARLDGRLDAGGQTAFSSEGNPVDFAGRAAGERIREAEGLVFVARFAVA
jgi:hypothetical protein